MLVPFNRTDADSELKIRELNCNHLCHPKYHRQCSLYTDDSKNEIKIENFRTILANSKDFYAVPLIWLQGFVFLLIPPH